MKNQNALNNKIILVTGAGGFIGSHLVEALSLFDCRIKAFVQYNSQNNWGWMEDVRPELLRRLSVISGDLRDPTSVKRAMEGCTHVFHLGALIAIPYSYDAPHEYIQTNIVGTLNVLQACVEGKVEHLIHTSTSEVYGTAKYTPMDEDHPLQGQSPYSASKIGADKMVESFFTSFGLPVTTVRPFNTYGPRQSARAVIPTIISQALTQKEIRLGSRHPIRDLTFVADTVQGFIQAAEHPESIGQTIHLGTGQGISVGDLANLILKLMKIEKPIIEDTDRMRPEKSEVLKLLSHPGKAESLLDWHPTFDLEAGLSKTIEWMQQHPSYYKPHLYNK